MNPCHFGRSEAPLFGAHHPPAGAARRDAGVVLCYPGPEEYMRVHWVYRQLVQHLTRQGFHVFKFDYYGTGDSAGAMGAGDLPRWRADVVTALEELRDVSGVARFALAGARLGAALAATLTEPLAAAGFKVDTLALWDPVVKGEDYLRELAALQARRIANCRYPLERLVNDNCPELLGYPLSESLRRSLLGLDLTTAPLTGCRQAVVVGSEDFAEYRALAGRFAAGSFLHVDENCYWRVQELLEQAILPGRIVAAVADALGTAAA